VSFEGVGKPVKFDAKGELASQDIYMYEVKENKMPLLGNTKDAKVE
jgi:branched-chain amino acid transport system substrate-binding protein